MNKATFRTTIASSLLVFSASSLAVGLNSNAGVGIKADAPGVSVGAGSKTDVNANINASEELKGNSDKGLNNSVRSQGGVDVGNKSGMAPPSAVQPPVQQQNVKPVAPTGQLKKPNKTQTELETNSTTDLKMGAPLKSQQAK